MEATDIVQSIFRWFHIFAGIIWIGLLYFFNWVNSAFAPTMDGDTKKKVVPELLPRALFWFRWGAAWTWITGVVLLLLVFYHGKIVLAEPHMSLGLSTWIMLAATFLGVFLYDGIMQSVGKANVNVAVILCFAIVVGIIAVMYYWAGFSYRAYEIHIGALFGTSMAYNVWFRIWPAQKKIITATKNGEKPDPAWVAVAGLRSKHNTYMSLPLIWMMINVHTTWASREWWILPLFILGGWWIINMCYRKAKKVPGF
ncbi:MAG: urate hydroxylase PuuD [bacterium]|nr:urate hydroxylase PuuD [bacterium]